MENNFFSTNNILDGLIFYSYLWIVAFALDSENFNPHPIALIMIPAFGILFIYLAYSLRRDGKKIASRQKLILYGAILFFVCFGLKFMANT